MPTQASSQNSVLRTGPTLWLQRPGPVFFFGPAHAGKSELAMQALAPDQPATVLGSAPLSEPAFSRRLAELQALRPAAWESLAAGPDLAAATEEAASRCGQVLIDSLSQWLATLLVGPEAHPGNTEMRICEMQTATAEVLRVIQAHPQVRFVLVSGEVGSAPAPARTADRLFRQAVGLANQKFAALAATVVSVQAGIGTIIKSQ